MFEIIICPIKKLHYIASDADLNKCAAVLLSSYPIEPGKLGDLQLISAHNFDDIINPLHPGIFKQDAANKISRFILGLPRDTDTLFICCDSGESRSAAIAAAVFRYYGLNEARIWNDPHYHPNPHVYTLMCRAFGLNISDNEISEFLYINSQAIKNAIKR